jgi:hypothetical protein
MPLIRSDEVFADDRGITIRTALMRTFVSRTNRALFFIKEGLQNLGSQPTLLRLLADLLHDGIERFSKLGRLAKPDARRAASFLRSSSDNDLKVLAASASTRILMISLSMTLFTINGRAGTKWLLYAPNSGYVPGTSGT